MITGDAAKDALIVAARKVHAEQMAKNGGIHGAHVTVDPALYLAAWQNGRLKVEKVEIPSAMWDNVNPDVVISSLFPKEGADQLVGFIGAVFTGEVVLVDKDRKSSSELPPGVLPTTTVSGRLTMAVLAADNVQVGLLEQEGEPHPTVFTEVGKFGPVGKALLEFSHRIVTAASKSDPFSPL
jgi:hypothetical protein